MVDQDPYKTQREMSKYWPKPKPAYLRFIHANEALMKCYAELPEKDWATMTRSAMDSKCMTQKEEIKRILRNNELNMTQLVKDRLHFLKAAQPDFNTRDELLTDARHRPIPREQRE